MNAAAASLQLLPDVDEVVHNAQIIGRAIEQLIAENKLSPLDRKELIHELEEVISMLSALKRSI